jgi:hypothetical protein
MKETVIKTIRNLPFRTYLNHKIRGFPVPSLNFAKIQIKMKLPLAYFLTSITKTVFKTNQ